MLNKAQHIDHTRCVIEKIWTFKKHFLTYVSLLIAISSCRSFKARLSMVGGGEESSSAEEIPSTASSINSDKLAAEESSYTTNGNDPNEDAQVYAEIDKEYQELLKRVKRAKAQRNIKLSQVKHLEKLLAEYKNASKLSFRERKRLKEKLERQIDFIVTWRLSSRSFTLICKNCNVQTSVDEPMLRHLEEDTKMFGGPWRSIDSNGNAYGPRYATARDALAALYRWYRSRFRFYVNTCTYCYLDNKIAVAEQDYKNAREKLDECRKKYKDVAHSFNKLVRKVKQRKQKVRSKEKELNKCKAVLDRYREVSKSLESLREEAIYDYKKLSVRQIDEYVRRRRY